MAERILYGLAQNLLTKLGSEAVQEIGLMYGVPKELTKLQETLSTIRDVILDSEEQQQISELGRSRAIASWIRRLKDVVYDADDLFDDFAAEDLRRKTDGQGRFGRRVSEFFASSNQVAFRVKMGHRIKGVRERMDEIANDISKLNFNPRVITEVQVENRGRETHSVVEKSHEIVGRDENKKEIIELLMQSSTQENLSLVVVVGMGGLGKTTLAQLVYNDQGVVKYFDLHMWVCVSNDFDVKILLRNIIKSATNRDVENLELDQLQKLLHRNLDGKRYLLVLDDVWNEDPEKWDQLRTLLPDGANGSKILATTRSIRVASVMGIHSPYVLEGLKEDESWELFQSLAFKKGEEKVRPNLVTIGEEIVKMCSGVPLVIKTLARILYFKTQESQWLHIKNNKNLMLLGDRNNILSVLRLSYDNLPIHLKQCFAYCALFPKDYRIEKKLLVQLWMAQGYIQPSNENEDLVDVGDQYFEDLLSRSLFQEVEKDAYNNILSCKMHDIIHDLAQSIVKSEVIILTDDVKNIPKEVHHVSFFKLFDPMTMTKDLKAKPIRTFFVLPHPHFDLDANKLISSYKCLRVLNLTGLMLERVPKSLANLSHLRYLDLSFNEFEVLPDAITRLKHLQTLKLFCCWHLKELPGNIKELINLRHLEIDESNRLTYMPCGLGELTMLQSLRLFRVGDDHGDKGIGRLNELNCLDNLRGELSIYCLSNVRGGALESKEANLKGKPYIQSLSLYWSGPGLEPEVTIESEEAKSVMEGLQPHSHLKEIYIKGYKGVRFPSWMMNPDLSTLLPNLVKIKMESCERCKVLPPFGQLPSLEDLYLGDLKAVEYMEDYSSSSTPFFPSLKTLRLDSLTNLEEWARRDIAEEKAPLFPCLSKLEIFDCRQLAALALPSSPSCLLELRIRQCHNLTSLSLPSSPCLSLLQISFCTNLTSLVMPLFPCLSELDIYFCPNLTSLQLPSFPCLSKFEISSCNNLTSLALPSFPCLSQLHIYDCNNVISLVLPSFPCLSELDIDSCNNLTSLLLPSFPCLSQLHIGSCPDLTSLQLSSYPCLSQLHIKNCPNLTSLLENYPNLTSVLESLSNLHTLRI